MARRNPSAAELRFGKRLAKLRNAQKLTQPHVASALDVTIQAVSGWERGASQPTIDKLPGLAKLYQQTIEGLIGIIPKGRVRREGVPVISFVQAGQWTSAEEALPVGGAERTVASDTPVSENAYALEIIGKSMERRFQEGDVIIVEPRDSLDPVPGDFVIAKLEDQQEATFKQYWRDRGEATELRPLNDEFPLITLDAITPGHIIGIVVEHHSYRRPGR